MSPIFEPHQVADAVAQALKEADVPADKENAIVAVATYDAAGHVVVRGVYAHRISHDTWNLHLSGMLGMDHEHHVEAGAEVKIAW